MSTLKFKVINNYSGQSSTFLFILFINISYNQTVILYDNDLLLLEDYSDEDVSMDRQMYRKTNIMKAENMFQHGIDNTTLEKDISQIKTIIESKA